MTQAERASFHLISREEKKKGRRGERGKKKYIAVKFRDAADAIPTQVLGVVMATKGFPVHQLEHSTY